MRARVANPERDIVKCAGTGCARKEQCDLYTHPARPKWQAWLFMPVAVPDTEKCRFFRPTPEKEKE